METIKKMRVHGVLNFEFDVYATNIDEAYELAEEMLLDNEFDTLHVVSVESNFVEDCE